MKSLYFDLKTNNKETSKYKKIRNPYFGAIIEKSQEQGKDLALSIKEKLNLYSISGFLAKEDMKYVKEVFSTIAEENIDLLSWYEIIQLIDYKDKAIGELLFKLQTTENQEEKSNLFLQIISLTNGVSQYFVQLACSKKENEDEAEEKKEFHRQLGNYQTEDNSIEDLLIKLKKVGEDKQKEVVDKIILLLSDRHCIQCQGATSYIRFQ